MKYATEELVQQIYLDWQNMKRAMLKYYFLTDTQFDAIMALTAQPDRTLALKDLEKRLFLTQTGVASLTTVMTKRGWMTKKVSSKDKRAKYVTATDKAIRFCGMVGESLANAQRSLTSGLTAEDAQDLCEKLNKAYENMSEYYENDFENTVQETVEKYPAESFNM